MEKWNLGTSSRTCYIKIKNQKVGQPLLSEQKKLEVSIVAVTFE